MSTDITRGPKRCPSCGKENPPTAARCVACLTRLEGAIQTTPAPAYDEVRLSPPDPDQVVQPPLKGCAAVAAAAGIYFLLLASFLVTFCTVCSATVIPTRDARWSIVGIPLGILAGAVVLAVLIAILRRSGWR